MTHSEPTNFSRSTNSFPAHPNTYTETQLSMDNFTRYNTKSITINSSNVFVADLVTDILLRRSINNIVSEMIKNET